MIDFGDLDIHIQHTFTYTQPHSHSTIKASTPLAVPATLFFFLLSLLFLLPAATTAFFITQTPPHHHRHHHHHTSISTTTTTTTIMSSAPPCSWPSMEGTLFTYYRDEYVNRVAFLSGSKQNKKHVVLIGGLGDGLLPVPYTKALAAALDTNGWSLVQVLLSSSYTGFGHSSLEIDAQELGHLVNFLKQELGSEGVGFVGHSTGTQDSVFYVKQERDDGDGDGNGAGHKKKLDFIILQAPVSDREHLQTQDKTVDFIKKARELQLNGQENEMMPREAFWTPITAVRFLDLATKEGRDDFFSSDLTDEELKAKLGHLDVPTLFLFSGADEYVPAGVDVEVLGQRFLKACEGVCLLPRAVVVEGATHSCRGHEDAVVEKMVKFIEEVEGLKKQ